MFVLAMKITRNLQLAASKSVFSITAIKYMEIAIKANKSNSINLIDGKPHFCQKRFFLSSLLIKRSRSNIV